ncbi:MAG: alpha/beta hydrolase [Pseudolabrys sp.]|nr:alpha/beta hydrolase [Pseudolabrys sp.]
MPVIDIEGAAIHYLKEGKGMPMFLLHSLGGSSEMWRRMIDALGEKFTFIAPDARGHGKSETRGDITVERYAQDAIAIADALKLTNFGVLGLSMGGQAAMHFAANDPARTLFLIAADTSLGAASKNPDRLEAARKRIADIGPKDFAAEYTKSRLRPNANSEDINGFADMVLTTLPDIYVAQLGSIMAQDLRPRVTSIKCPALIIVGADDVSTPPSTAELLCKSIEGALLKIIPDANHLSNIDQPAAFNSAVADFAVAISSAHAR